MPNGIYKSQIAAIHTLLRVHGLTEQKVELVMQYSKGETGSVAGLSFSQAQDMLKMLNGIFQTKEPDPRDKMWRHIIAMAREMGTVYREKIVKDGILKEVSNYTKLHEWMDASSYLKKPMNDYTYQELPKLVSQFKNIYQSWLKKSKEQI